VSGVDITTVLFDTSPNPTPIAAESWTPAVEPSDATLVAEGVKGIAGLPARVARRALHAARNPLETAAGSRLPSEITIVPVLRAGLGMVDGFLRLLPGARVGHVGVYRDEQEHRPVDYYERLPPGLADSHVFVVDPMLATGGSAVHALDRLRAAGAQRLALVCLVVAPEGLAAVEEHHPDVPVWTAAVDRELDENAYIRPGLGDAGDRVFGT